MLEAKLDESINGNQANNPTMTTKKPKTKKLDWTGVFDSGCNQYLGSVGIMLEPCIYCEAILYKQEL